MSDETADLAETLAFTIGVILQSDADKRRHIAQAYQEARQLVETIPRDNGDARPKIIACLERFEICKSIENVACAGWMLAALLERVNEQNLSGWRKLRKVIDKAVKMLPLPKPTLH